MKIRHEPRSGSSEWLQDSQVVNHQHNLLVNLRDPPKAFMDYGELFEEVLGLFDEEYAANPSLTSQDLANFINDFLPYEVIQHLESLQCDDHDDDFYQSLYHERYASKDEEELLLTNINYCQLCERDVVRLTRHHLYPREIHNNLRKRGYEMDDLNKCIIICRMCHSYIHKRFTNVELASSYYTIELLLSDEKIQKFSQWASKLSNQRTKKVK